MSMTNSINLVVNSNLSGSSGLASLTTNINQNVSSQLTDSDGIFTVSSVLGSGGASYDLSGALLDPLGNTVIFTEINCLMIKNTSVASSGSDNELMIGGSNSIGLLNGSTDEFVIPAGGTFFVLGDYTVVAGSGDLLILSGLSGVTYEIIIIGKQ